MVREELDIETMNENDPKAKASIIKFKQQKVNNLSD